MNKDDKLKPIEIDKNSGIPKEILDMPEDELVAACKTFLQKEKEKSQKQ